MDIQLKDYRALKESGLCSMVKITNTTVAFVMASFSPKNGARQADVISQTNVVEFEKTVAQQREVLQSMEDLLADMKTVASAE